LPERAERGTGGGPDRILLLLTLLGFAVRVAFLLFEPACEAVGDEPTWLALALHELGRPNRGLSPFRTRVLFYPPVYPYFIAILARVFGSARAVLWAQTVLGALLVPAVGRVGRLAIGRRTGLVAAAITAVYPELPWYSAHYWSETVYVLLLWWAIERTLAADSAPSSRTAAAAGALWGLSCLTRELSLYLVPIAVVWLLRAPIATWWRMRAARTMPWAWGRAGMLVLATVLVVAPWTVRNAIVYHAFVPVSTMGGLNLWQGNTRLTHLEIYAVLATKGGPVERDRYCRAMAWQSIAARQPWWVFEKIHEQMPEFWKANAEVLDHVVGRQACGPLSRGQVIALEIAFVAPYLLVLAIALVGLARLRLTGGSLLPVVLLAAYNAAHVIAYATTRFRLPVLPVLFLLAGAALAGGREGALHPLSRRRWLLLLLLLLLTLATLYPGMEELSSWRQLTGAPPL
jgi:hypothetical protein